MHCARIMLSQPIRVLPYYSEELEDGTPKKQLQNIVYYMLY